MAENKKDQGFTKEQLEELQFDDIANVIPGGGVLALGTRKGVTLVKLNRPGCSRYFLAS